MTICIFWVSAIISLLCTHFPYCFVCCLNIQHVFFFIIKFYFKDALGIILAENMCYYLMNPIQWGRYIKISALLLLFYKVPMLKSNQLLAQLLHFLFALVSMHLPNGMTRGYLKGILLQTITNNKFFQENVRKMFKFQVRIYDISLLIRGHAHWQTISMAPLVWNCTTSVHCRTGCIGPSLFLDHH